MFDHAARAALNHLLAGASWAREALRPHAGRSWQLTAPPLRLQLGIGAEGYFTLATHELMDVSISLPATTPWQLLRALQQPSSLMAAARLEGQADLADALGLVLRNLRWDYEEDLSRVVGDVAATRLGQGIRAAHHWQQEAAQRLGVNFSEYLDEEQALVVSREKLHRQMAAVQALHEQLSALERRVQGLNQA